MNIAGLKQIIPFIQKHRVALWLWGAHGKGKTEVTETFYRENGDLVFNFRLNTQADEGDIIGIQDFVTDSKGNKIATKHCMPEWLLKAIEFCKNNPTKRALIFFDEINRASRPGLIGPIFQMSIDRKLHTYDFSMYNIDIIVAANYDNDSYNVLTLEDKALLSRFMHVNFEPDVEEFISYAKDKNYNPGLVSFLQQNPGMIEENINSPSISQYATPDRRKQRVVSDLLNANLPDNLQFEALVGLGGTTFATSLTQHLKEIAIENIEYKEILNGYKAATRKKFLGIRDNQRSDIIDRLNSDLLAYLKESNHKLPAKEVKAVQNYILDLPADYAFLLTLKILPVCVPILDSKHEKFTKELTKKISSVPNKEELTKKAE